MCSCLAESALPPFVCGDQSRTAKQKLFYRTAVFRQTDEHEESLTTDRIRTGLVKESRPVVLNGGPGTKNESQKHLQWDMSLLGNISVDIYKEL